MSGERSIDLHTHSTASDGADTPSQIVQQAAGLGLTAVALTDHDTVSGIKEFLEKGREFAHMAVVPGVEISVDLYGSEAHIVGLFINPDCPSLNKLLKEIRDNRDRRNLHVIEKLQKRGYDITLDEVLEIARGESVGRPHFAKILIGKGYFTETQEVFDKCLKQGAPGYVKRKLPKPDRAIRAIHDAGGLAIWSHALYRRDNERAYVKKTLKTLLKAGLDGLETRYTTFTQEQQKLLEEFAETHALIQSGGSDYHGQNQPKIALATGYGNLSVPEEFFHDLFSLSQQKKGK